MSLKNIETLSLNPHFFKHLCKCFLSGYGKPCDLKLLFMILPILLYEPSRQKLSTAKSTSRLDSLFNSKIEIQEKIKISGKTRLTGFLSRYEMLKHSTKETIIILHSQQEISIAGKYISIIAPISYTNYDKSIRAWMKAAFYLGMVFSKSGEDNINYFLGVG